VNKTYSSRSIQNRTVRGLWIAIGSMIALIGGAPFAQAAVVTPAGGTQGAGFQGAGFQGAGFQGAGFQGPIVASGLAGQTFISTLADGSVAELTGFRGVDIDATIADPSSGSLTTTTLSAPQLLGMTWYAPLCDATHCIDSWYRITDANTDNSSNTMLRNSSNADIWMFRVEYTIDISSDMWSNVCDTAYDGIDLGVFVNGTWEDDGDWNSVGYTFSCTSGVIAKCSRGWGYKPWVTVPVDNGTMVDLQPLHEACTRTARADYCGDGVAHTVDGLLVDIFDVYGLNVNEYVQGFSEEASFDEHGAVSFVRRRVLNHPNSGTCEAHLPHQPPVGVTPLLWVWSHPTVIPYP
jgi:hypothetical protein